jgi:hypothetical protein
MRVFVGGRDTYRVSYRHVDIDRRQPRREEFPTEPAAALGSARELVEDVSYKTVIISEILTSAWGPPMHR